MSTFSETFREPVYDYEGDTGFALDGAYTREKATELFKEVAKEPEEGFNPKNMEIWYVRFYGDWTEDGEFKNLWWWGPLKTGKRGEKAVWVSNGKG